MRNRKLNTFSRLIDKLSAHVQLLFCCCVAAALLKEVIYSNFITHRCSLHPFLPVKISKVKVFHYTTETKTKTKNILNAFR